MKITKALMNLQAALAMSGSRTKLDLTVSETAYARICSEAFNDTKMSLFGYPKSITITGPCDYITVRCSPAPETEDELQFRLYKQGKVVSC